MRLRELKEKLGNAIRVIWKAHPLLIEEQPDRVFSEHARDEWVRCDELCDGVEYRLPELGSPMPSSSVPALLAEKCAQVQGDDHAERFRAAVMDAFFTQGRDISQRDVLSDLAGQAGLDVLSFWEAYESEGPRRALLADFEEAKNLKIAAVPTVIFADDNGAVRVRGEVTLAAYERLVKWFAATSQERR